MATGFHGAHVIIGSIFLIVCLFRALAGQFTPTQHLGFEFAAWYWHFVDVVWLFLFACIYVWGGGAVHAGMTRRLTSSRAGRGTGRPAERTRAARSCDALDRACAARTVALADGRATAHERKTIDTLAGSIRAGLACACPRCGKGKLFQGFLTLRPQLRRRAGSIIRFADAGDGPAVFIMFFAGFIVVGAALVTEIVYRAAVLGARGAVAAADPDRDARAAAADEGPDDRAAVSSQGRGRTASATRRAVNRRRRRSAPRRTWLGLLVPALLRFAVLIGLGTWQIQRKAWKEGADRDADRAATRAAERRCRRARNWPSLDPRQRRIQPRHLHRARSTTPRRRWSTPRLRRSGRDVSGPGYWVFTPARLADGGIVMVNRGFVPEDQAKTRRRARRDR